MSLVNFARAVDLEQQCSVWLPLATHNWSEQIIEGSITVKIVAGVLGSVIIENSTRQRCFEVWTTIGVYQRL